MDDAIYRINTAEAASLLGVTERRARQLARFLHAERDEMGNWWFDKAAVLEHSEVRAMDRKGKVAMARLEDLERDVDRLAQAVDLVMRTLGAHLIDVEDTLERHLSTEQEEAPNPGEGNPESGAVEQADD